MDLKSPDARADNRLKSTDDLRADDEERKKAKARIAQLDAAQRAKKYKKKEKKKKEKEENTTVKRSVSKEEIPTTEQLLFTYQPHDEPAYFDVAVEKRHVEHLHSNKLDRENRL